MQKIKTAMNRNITKLKTHRLDQLGDVKLTAKQKRHIAKLCGCTTNNVTHVGRGEVITSESGNRMPKWYAELRNVPKEERQKIRSKTFPGIANAMATQWGEYLLKQ
jgi:hypothetical protein